MNGLNIRLVPKLSLGMHTSGRAGVMVFIPNEDVGNEGKTLKQSNSTGSQLNFMYNKSYRRTT